MSEKIIFFDGVCNLCNGFINFIFKFNSDNSLKVAPLQGSTAKNKLNENEIQKLSTVIYVKNNKKYFQSSAVLEVFKDMGFPFSLMYLFIIIPTSIRNAIYDLIAKNRYRIFGEKDTCRLPTPEEKVRFLP